MTNWTEEHFITYVFLCVAFSDHEIDDSELQTINSFVANIVECDKLSKAIIEEVRLEIVAHTKEERRALIRSKMNEVKLSTTKKRKLVLGIEEIIIADDNVDSDEMDFYRFLKRLFREELKQD